LEEFHDLALPYYSHLSSELNLKELSAVLQPRVETLGQIPAETDFFAHVPDYSAALYENKKMKTDVMIAKKALELALPVLRELTSWNNEALFESLKALASANEMKNGQILYPLRIALSGKETTPGGATEIAVILGRNETLKRLTEAMNKLA
ncbi:MAG: glutamate--tRNA ligase, partial [Alphaproteobacteria bacterium]|nr:glutamate--tRNA ligase [Alphaproteobacteria bacterium]